MVLLLGKYDGFWRAMKRNKTKETIHFILGTSIEHCYYKIKESIRVGQIEEENKNKNIEQNKVNVRHHLFL